MQKWRQAGAISQGDTAKECVDAFMSLVGATLPDLKVEENLLEILCAVCVAELRDEMKEYARKRFATISKREAKRVKLEGEAGNEYYNDGDQNYSTQNENAVDDASIQNHQIPLSQAARSILSSLENTGNNSNNTSISTSISSLKTARLWQPSVRAKQASQALQEVSSVRISTGANTTAAMAGKLSFQARLDDMRLKKDSDTSTKTGGPLQCGICKENKIVPCIAECGHVCCGPCWKSWIQKLEAVSKLVTCPLCRQTVNVDSIKRVKLM